jgi:hypothetical protein
VPEEIPTPQMSMWMNLSFLLILRVVCRLRRQALAGDDIFLAFYGKVKLVSVTKTFVSAEIFVALDLIAILESPFLHICFVHKQIY